MRIRVLSDLHLEFFPDRGAAFLASLDTDCDVLVLAGDITGAVFLDETLAAFAQRFRQIVYVPGNHEHYGTYVNELRDGFKSNPPPANVHVLDNAVAEIDGVRFVGSTLWFRHGKNAPTWTLADFSEIHGGFPWWVAEENRRAEEFLRANVRRGDVVVTHHLPSHRSISRRFQGSPLNVFFWFELGELIASAKPAVWVHGHTHDACDYVLGETRVVCNPHGYIGHESQEAFDPRKTIEIGNEAKGTP